MASTGASRAIHSPAQQASSRGILASPEEALAPLDPRLYTGGWRPSPAPAAKKSASLTNLLRFAGRPQSRFGELVVGVTEEVEDEAKDDDAPVADEAEKKGDDGSGGYVHPQPPEHDHHAHLRK